MVTGLHGAMVAFQPRKQEIRPSSPNIGENFCLEIKKITENVLIFAA